MLNHEFSKILLAWHKQNARDLPWRGETDPYRIWLSEIMLQQTRTETVKRYYEKFLAAFENVHQLANAEEAEVLKLWEGLGYYSRARNLHAAAKLVSREMKGVFPTNAKALRALPGVGEYAAGAIASIAFGEKEPALDGNQARVLSRVMNIRSVIKTPGQLRECALALMPDEETGEYNQALMGLGALVCISGKPRCGECPVRGLCAAYAAGDPEALPVKPEKTARKIETRAVALVICGRKVLVRKRGKGLLQGLWEFPGFTDARGGADVSECLSEMGIRAEYAGECGTHVHVFTHLEWHMKGFLFRAQSVPEGAEFVSADELDALAMPTAIRPFRERAVKILREEKNHA